MSKAASNTRPPTQEEIAACAHRIWESEGRPQGKAMEHWLQAEAQMIAERKASIREQQQQQMPATTTAAATPATAPKNRAPAPAPQRGNSTPPQRQNLHQN